MWHLSRPRPAVQWTALLLAALFCAACTARPTPTAPLPSVTVAVALPSSAPTPTAPPSSAPLPTPSRTPYVHVPEPTVIAARVRDELRAVPTRSPGGRPAWRIGGWTGGLRSHRYGDGAYRWLDDGHLLLYLLCSREAERVEISQPTVLSLADGQAWPVPPDKDWGAWDLVQWSAALGRLVIVNNGELQLFDLQGNLAGRIAGARSGILFLSPSGRRAFADSAWFDLESGRRVGFQQLDIRPVLPLHWTSDESRVFTCCYTYADAQSGLAYQTGEVDGLFAPGQGVGPGTRVQTGRWLAGDRYFWPSRGIVRARASRDQAFAGAVIFDPAEKAWVDVLAQAGRPAWSTGRGPDYSPPAVYPSPDGQLLAIGHATYARDGDRPVYLVDITTFAGRAIAGSEGMRLISWSGDGRYLLLGQPGQGCRLASIERAALEPGIIPIAGDRRPLWQPDGARLAYVEDDGRRVCIWDAAAGRLEGGIDLPAPLAQLAWSERGGQLAMLDEEGRLWWLADPAAGRAEQLTPPIAGAGTVRWSPDSGQLAVAGTSEVVVVRLRD